MTEMDTIDVVLEVVESMTGIEAEPSFSLEECGLASIGITQLVGLINKRLAQANGVLQVQISVVDMAKVESIASVAAVVAAAKEAAAVAATEAM